jgi:hypothetical protein
MPKLPAPLQTVVANCLAHGRRAFVKVIASFPEQCRFVLETLGEVYRYDEQTRAARLTPEQRLHFHRQHSKPVMDKLEAWLKAQFAERLVEPNSGLGKAISYLTNHWPRLTLFLERAGAPLDNNLAERSLKKAILHRKNSLFYKTRNGARMGDLLRTQRRQPFRLPHRVAAERRAGQGGAGRVDALELPRAAGLPPAASIPGRMG